MNDQAIKDEILSRINPQTYAMSSGNLIDIMNEFDVSQEDAVFLYSEVVREQREELKDTSKEVVDYFRSRGQYYPSFEQFKREFDRYETQPYIGDEILRNMHKQETEDPKQTALFELRKQIREEFRTMNELDGFEKAASKIKKDWGGETEPEEKFSAEEFFGDAGDAAQADIEKEYGEEEFAPYGTMEDPRGLKDLDEEEGIDQKGLLQLLDAAGNPVKRGSFVGPADGSGKRGYVKGLVDDGKGKTVLVVNWEWPINMKHEAPKEMGKMKEYPENLIVQNTKNENKMNEEINEEVVNEEIVNEECGCDKDCDCKKEELDEMRGLGAGVRNSGDRNVKQRDDHAHAPLTNLSESLDGKIKTLFEGIVKRKDLIKFISEEAKGISKDIE